MRELPGPTTCRPPIRPSTPAQPIDTSDLIREPVTAADRTNEQLIDSADIPIADLRELAIRFKGLPADTPLKNCTTAPTYNVGDAEQFDVLNADSWKTSSVDATLIAKNRSGLHVAGQPLAQPCQSRRPQASRCRLFSDKIMPRDHALFGQEESPGIDCDPRIHILNTSNTGAGGYFSSVDQVTQQVRPDSNEKDIFFIDIEGSGGPRAIGARLLQRHHGARISAPDPRQTRPQRRHLDQRRHVGTGDVPQRRMIRFRCDRGPNPGHSTQLVAGRRPGQAPTSTARPSRSCCTSGIATATRACRRWPPKPANGLAGIQNVLNKIDPGKQADDLVADWLIARLLDDPSIDNGRYGYRQSDRVKVEPRQTIDHYPFSEQAQVHQYAGDYTAV